MTFDEWVRIGIDHQWAIPVVCATHDGTPMTPEEEALWEQGDGPCMHIIRVCEPHQHQAIYNNTTAMKWRDL